MRYVRLTLVVLLLSAVAGYAAWARLENGTATEAKGPVDGSGKPAPAAAAAGKGDAQQAPRQGGGGPRVAVATAVAARETLPLRRTAVGWVEPVATVTVRARIDGEIVEQLVEDGQVVRKGDVLFRLDDREIRATIARDEAQLQKDMATVARTQADLQRARDLAARKFAPAQQVDQAEANAKIAAATVEADKAVLDTDRIKAGYTTVTAPIDGRLGVVRVTPGNLVRGSDSSGDGLVTITQMRPVRVSFTMPDRELPMLRKAMDKADAAGPVPVRAFLHADLAAEEKPKGEGTLDFLDSSVDQASGTITAKALMPNEDGALWPGQYVDVEVDFGASPDVTVIPLVAVQPGQAGPFVWVVKADGGATVRPVKVGERAGQDVAILSGLEPGEHVVTDGQLRLREGTKVAETVAGGAPKAEAAAGAAGAGGRS